MKAYPIADTKYAKTYTLVEKEEIREAIKSELPEATYLTIDFMGGATVYIFGEHKNENYADDFANQYGVINDTEASSWAGGIGSEPVLYQFSILFNASLAPQQPEAPQVDDAPRIKTGDTVTLIGDPVEGTEYRVHLILPNTAYIVNGGGMKNVDASRLRLAQPQSTIESLQAENARLTARVAELEARVDMLNSALIEAHTAIVNDNLEFAKLITSS